MPKSPPPWPGSYQFKIRLISSAERTFLRFLEYMWLKAKVVGKNGQTQLSFFLLLYLSTAVAPGHKESCLFENRNDSFW